MLCSKFFLLADVEKNLLFFGVQLLEFGGWLMLQLIMNRQFFILAGIKKILALKSY